MVDDNVNENAAEEQVLTPDDGYRLVVRLMRRYINHQQHIADRIERVTPFGYSQVRIRKGAPDSE